MPQKSRKRGLQPAPSKSFWSQKCCADTTPESIDQGVSHKQSKIVPLRREGKTPQEIADAVGVGRLDVFRYLLRVLTHNERLQLGIPT
jgi:hypothetical protein